MFWLRAADGVRVLRNPLATLETPPVDLPIGAVNVPAQFPPLFFREPAGIAFVPVRAWPLPALPGRVTWRQASFLPLEARPSFLPLEPRPVIPRRGSRRLLREQQQCQCHCAEKLFHVDPRMLSDTPTCQHRVGILAL